MPRLEHKIQEDEHTLEATSVCEIMDRFYQLYLVMAQDPCLEDLAGDVAEIMIELDERRDLAMLVAAEEDLGMQSSSVH